MRWISTQQLPKTHDSEGILRCRKELVVSLNKHHRILADGHYTKLKDSMQRFKWITPYRKPRKSMIDGEKINWNTKQRLYRNKIEHLFGKLSLKWKCFTVPWRHSLKSRERAIRIALAVWNFNKKET